MKRIFLFIVLLIATCNIVFAQKPNIDSLQKVYNKNRQDTTLVQIYFLKSMYTFLTTNVDSGLIYSRKALELSQKINFRKGVVRALSGIATYQNLSGDLPGSLKTTFQALPEAIDLKEMRVVASCYNTRGLTYSTLKDAKRSLDNYYAALYICEKYHYTGLAVTELNNVARAYLDNDKLDSARYYCQYAYDFSIKHKIKRNLAYLVRNFGIIKFKEHDYPSAISYYRKSLADTSEEKNHYLKSEDYRRIAEAYVKMNLVDSAIYYAKIALEHAKGDKNPDLVQRATTILTDQYKLKDDYKNAFYYQQVTQQAKDSLFSQQKTLQVQNLAYSEEQRKQEAKAAELAYGERVRFYVLLGVIGVFVLIAGILLYANGQRKKANVLLHKQNEQIETQRKDLEKTVADLRTTQRQLIQSEKMASLGELTAGIAHEIQNPLNFVNNFSEVNTELIEEMEMEISQSHLDEVKAIAESIKLNQEKISQHGKRADFIVKGMLQHSRASTGEKQLTNLNVLADEFFKLSFHGLRAKDKSFNAEMVTHFDPDLPKANVVQQDMGRVLLNLINNAFYAVNQKAKTAAPGYKPTVELTTSAGNGQIEIRVKDNGNGIPASIKDKIMQPFFTTKPTGEGTGLGLSLSYDIVTKGHGGKIDVDSKEGEYTEFKITLPIS
ncbi:MAG: GHKL domain-containing protein [Bacteroidetes bacterium]|nr:GHKL domain-containing protein [Bacteroidota bacterium]